MHNDKIDLRSLVRCIHKSNRLVFKWRKSYIVLSFFFSFALGLLPIMSTLVMQQVLNAIQMHNTLFQNIAIHVIVYIIIEILIVILNLRYRYETNKCFRIINKNIQLSIMRKAGEMRLTDFENAEIHNKLKRAQEGANSICSFISGFFAMLSVLASIFSSLIVLSRYNLYLILIIIIVPVCEYFFLFRISRLQYTVRKRRTGKERTIWYLGYIVKTGICVKELKLFGLSDFWAKKVDTITSEIIDEDMSIAKKGCIGQTILGICEVIISGVIFALIILDGIHGKILIGDVITYNKLIFGIKGNVESILSTVEKMLKDALDVSNYFELIEIPTEEVRPQQINKINSICFKNVTFRYESSNKAALNNVSFELSAGESIALVGVNGSGKSTILKLLLGLYDNYTGTILVNDIDLRQINKASYSKRVSCIFQDYMKYESTVRENIACSDINSIKDDVQIQKALLSVDFCKQGNQRIDPDNVLGSWFDDAIQLSGGEWQRIALGRMLFKHADMYILDEPSASLDPNSEEMIMQQYQKLINSGKIGLICSHSIIKVGKYADRIIVVDQGRIVENGTHKELIEKEGIYYNLYNSYI